MKIALKLFCFVILPIITVVAFVIIGGISMQHIHAAQGNHQTMSGPISLMAWSCRGVVISLLMIAYSIVLFSKTANAGKLLVLLLILILNIPIMYFMELIVFSRVGLLIIPIVNAFAFIPVLIRKYPQTDL